MCGIAAIISKSPSEIKVRSMLDKISHRGPDGATIDLYPNACIGHNRLAITDAKSPASNQPGKAGKTIVYFNGEIYNYKSLSVYKFGMTEVEVLAAGFDRFGTEFVKQLNGMFAIILNYKSHWYAIRDRYGIKPLYYWIHNQEAHLVSEIKSLTALEYFTAQINPIALTQWRCMNNIVSDDTIFNEVYHIRPGTIVNLNEWTVTQYWQWDFSPEPMTYNEAVDTTRDLVTAAINKQRPQIPYGTCLSGGVDSGIIRTVLGDIPSFSVGYTSVRDEREQIRTQESLGYHIIYSKVENFDQSMFHLENPRVGASWPNFGLYELASKFVKVLFDGSGADELFGGYSWRYDPSKKYQDVLSRTNMWSSICEDIMRTELKNDTVYDRYRIDAKWFLTGVLEVVDKLSMAHSIEIRVPFLDNDVVDFAQKIPAEFKDNKRILKDAFSYVLPSAVINGSKKGFTSPDWIDGKGDNQAVKWNDAAINVLKTQYFHQ